MRKLKVVWITYFSNETIRKHLHFDKKSLLGIYRTYFRKKQWYEGDFAQWNTNAIKEFENFNNIELHIIVPFYNLKYNNENFTYNNVHYHFFKPYDDKLIYSLKKKFFKKRERKYSNAQSALKIIENIDPEIIHLIGAENPFYSSTPDRIVKRRARAGKPVSTGSWQGFMEAKQKKRLQMTVLQPFFLCTAFCNISGYITNR